ncbi:MULTISPECIES: LysR family transcriptional regulator [unclassified Variovorax]|jgi:DNA-binding transcriptional LysR family regulator|uniref:LysR family transcriptional regulator n=1 Tax=unclassified Variovorax TaxID=663243 RepID=UPI0008B0D604|nr:MULTISPECIES: LysR family transcriptional regulator [unclassified Variovorax]SEJ05247.1 DNA-binding transcriptional regulator, LysR family [Variovorax sp. OK202]SFB94080.1 DNA-binding transcriptional regulator, LysR family [Variovorax sp. OK212]
MHSIKNNLASSINFEQLRTFALVLEAGSFSAAAERLGLTQPAVSVQVKQLERRLGVRLIERVGRRIGPTPAGADLMAELPHVTAALSNAINAATFHSAGVAGRVRLGTGGTSCLYLLPPVLRDLRARYPLLNIIVSTGNTESYVRRVEDNSVDAALVTLPVSSRALAVTPILRDDFVAICQRGSTRWPDTVTARELDALPLVKFVSEASARGIVDDWLRRGGRTSPPVMEFDSVEAIKAMVAAGLGVAILPKMAVTGRGHHAELDLRPLHPPLHRTLALITRNDKPVTKGLRQVIDAVVAAGHAAEAAGAAEAAEASNAACCAATARPAP